MGKLVRDGIPDIIRASGREPHTRRLNHAEFRQELLAKLVEEAAEAGEADESHLVEELGDVLEVLQALATDVGIPWSAVTAAADTKRARRGGFAGRIYLE